MLAFLRTFAAVTLALWLFVTVPLLMLLIVATLGDEGPRPHSWLTIRLSESLLEYYGPPTIRTFFEDPPPCLMEITEVRGRPAIDAVAQQGPPRRACLRTG